MTLPNGIIGEIVNPFTKMPGEMTSMRYQDRVAAARQLAASLDSYRGRSGLLVLALPRGGVPVGYEIAQALDAELDLIVVRKLGLPFQPEVAMGAIASGGIRVKNSRVIAAAGVSTDMVEKVERQELKELRRREQTYRGDRARPAIAQRCVILVDDGLATGSTMLAAVRAIRKQEPAEVIIAVPVAPADSVDKLRQEADAVICPMIPQKFCAIGQFYQDFSQLDDQQVRECLQRAWRTPQLTSR